MEWLKAESTDEKKIPGTGLLLAPVYPDNPAPTIEPTPDIVPEVTPEIISSERDDPMPEFFPEDLTDEPEIIEQEQEEEHNADSVEDISSEILELHETVKELQKSLDTDTNITNIEEDNEQSRDININVDTDEGNDGTEEDYTDDIQKSWEETAGFALNLNEPPPEIWTRINIGESSLEDSNPDEEFNDDEDELDYEQGMSLQGAAYVPKSKHGKNFTERLHQTLRGRKQKAEQLREQQEENKPHHPYISKSLIICATMLIVMGFVGFALWFIQQWTPTGLYQRAEAKFQSGDYEAAMNLFQRGYKRYPNVLSFLTGLAKSSESAGHVQTAIVAWEAYINSLPKDDKENKNFAQSELKRLKGDKESEQTPSQEKSQSEIKKPEVKTESKDSQVKIPVSFDDFLHEGNNAYNLKLFSPAIIYFARAMELNGSDVRAYIGLAKAYEAKGMYFDSKRILDEALRKFKRNPTIETALRQLKTKH
mgnify:CR=1 FL=1